MLSKGFFVKLTYIAILGKRVAADKLPSRSARLICTIVYAYACMICEETFDGCWWSFSWFDQKVKDIMHSSCFV